MGTLLLKQRERVFGVDGVGEFTIERQNQKTNKGVMWELICIRPSPNPKVKPEPEPEIVYEESEQGDAEQGDASA